MPAAYGAQSLDTGGRRARSRPITVGSTTPSGHSSSAERSFTTSVRGAGSSSKARRAR